MNKETTLEKAHKIRELFKQGFGIRQIMEELKISRPSLYRLIKMVGGFTDEDRTEHFKNKGGK